MHFTTTNHSMRRIRPTIISCLTVVLLTICMLTACGQKEKPALYSMNINADNRYEVPNLAIEEWTDVADDVHVKVTGRTALQGTDRWMIQSASAVEFEFYGTAASIDIHGDFTSENEELADNQTHLGIELDGERVIDTLIKAKDNTFDVLTGDGQEAAWHTVKIIKLSEAMLSNCAITGIHTTSAGGIRPTVNRSLYVEFIGDSVTCGYGVLGETNSDPFLTETEDATLSYAGVAGAILDADISCVSYSGFGVYSGYPSKSKVNDTDLLSLYYDKITLNAGLFESENEDDNVWYKENVTRRDPDIVVIHLGTNDGIFTGYNKTRVGHFYDCYLAFIDQVRQANPDAKIICTLGTMSNLLCPQIEEAVEEYKANTGENNVYYFELPIMTYEEGYGSGWHPSRISQQKSGTVLAEFISSIQ